MRTQLTLTTLILEPLSRGVTFVLSQHVSPSFTFTSTVKAVAGSPQLISIKYVLTDIGPDDTTYVRTVMYRLPLDGVESLSTKCPVEKEVTEQEYVNITPVVEDDDLNPMELLKLTKRLVICTQCGSLRLIN